VRLSSKQQQQQLGPVGTAAVGAQRVVGPTTVGTPAVECAQRVAGTTTSRDGGREIVPNAWQVQLPVGTAAQP
jgi:predicted membrane-bound mannosyltransferase